MYQLTLYKQVPSEKKKRDQSHASQANPKRSALSNFVQSQAALPTKLAATPVPDSPISNLVFDEHKSVFQSMF
jgi:hypothetical protein